MLVWIEAEGWVTVVEDEEDVFVVGVVGVVGVGFVGVVDVGFVGVVGVGFVGVVGVVGVVVVFLGVFVLFDCDPNTGFVVVFGVGFTTLFAFVVEGKAYLFT